MRIAHLSSCIVLVAALLPALAHAQSDKMLFRFGYTYEIYNASSSQGFASNTFGRGYSSVQVDAYRVLWQKNDLVSAGVSPGFGLSVRPINTQDRGIKTDFLIQVPVLMGLRLGARSTTYNQQKIGVGVGLGVLYTYATYTQGYNGTSSTDTRTLNYVAPQVQGELTLNMRSSVITGRIHLSPLNLTNSVHVKNNVNNNFANESLPSLTTNMGVGIAYGF
jgi:hypothetical protein